MSAASLTEKWDVITFALMFAAAVATWFLLCSCKDAICWSCNKFPSLHSLKPSNPNWIISQRCCGLLVTLKWDQCLSYTYGFSGIAVSISWTPEPFNQDKNSRKGQSMVPWMLSNTLHALDSDEYFEAHLMTKPCQFKIKDSVAAHASSCMQSRKRII